MVFKFQRKLIPYEMRKLGIYLERLRKEANFSIRDVAQKADITPSYLHKIEKGDSFSTLSVHTILKLSKFYNVPIAAFLKDSGLIDNDENELPDLPQYLRGKYRLSPQAIRDMVMAKEIVDKKYQAFRR